MAIQHRRWLNTIIAVLAIVYGVLVLGKPFWTLESLPLWLTIVAVMLLLWPGSPLHRSAIGLVVVAVAITLVMSRDFAIALLVYGVLAYAVFSGIHALGKLRDRQWFTAILGAALVLIGILGAYWVDVASILIGLLVGPVLILTGIIILVREWRGSQANSQRHGWIMWAGRVGSVLLLVLTMAATAVTFRAIQAEPVVDSFAEYNEPLGDEPGVLLKTASFTRGMPENSTATRILYTTTGHDGEIALATGFVIVPNNAPEEPLPVILWTHGTTGIDVTCAPSLLELPFSSNGDRFHELPLEQGWALVVPDYLGLGASPPHPYIVGQPTAQSSLDAVRAARQMDSASLSDDTVVWGHSQGGGAALWVGIEQPDYAPDVPLLGVAALSPASNLPEFIDTLIEGKVGPIFGGYIMRGFSDWYDDVEIDDYIRPGARFSQEKVIERCIDEPSFIANLVSAVIREPFTHADLHSGPLYERLQENVPSKPTGLPLFLGQGLTDPLITPHAQTDFVNTLCGNGQVVEYHTYAGRDHLGVVADDSPMLTDLMTWTEARFAGEPAAESCTTTENSD